MILSIGHSGKGKAMAAVRRSMVARELEEGIIGRT